MSASTDPAERIVAKLWRDISGRRGCGFDDIDLDIQHEILDTWIGLAAAEIDA